MDLQRPIRVLLVGRHFWPHGSFDSAGHLIDLATGLRAAGFHLSILTPKYANAWAEKLMFREMSVYRPVRMFKQGWTPRADRTPSRYIKNLRQWIEEDSTSCDVIVCCGAREEAIAAISAAKQVRVPVIVRLEGRGTESDLQQWEASRSLARCRSFVADAGAVVTASADQHRNWIATGGDPKRTHRVDVGVGPTIDSGHQAKAMLRRSMSKINGDLFVPESCHVALSVERMTDGSGVMTLVKQAYSLSSKIKGLQYWLIGDGPKRDTIFTRMRSDGLRQSTSMPGSFGVMSDVFAASDLMVHCGIGGFDHQIPSAIAASLPLVIANSAAAREYFGVSAAEASRAVIERLAEVSRNDDSPTDHSLDKSVGPWWFDAERPKTLRFAIQQIVSDLEQARARATELRRTFQRQQPRSESIEKMAGLIRRLVEASR